MEICKKVEIDLAKKITLKDLLSALEQIENEAGADADIEMPDYYTLTVSWTEEV